MNTTDSKELMNQTLEKPNPFQPLKDKILQGVTPERQAEIRELWRNHEAQAGEPPNEAEIRWLARTKEQKEQDMREPGEFARMDAEWGDPRQH